MDYELVLRDSFQLYRKYFLFIVVALLIEYGVTQIIPFATKFHFVLNGSQAVLLLLTNFLLDLFCPLIGNAVLLLFILNKETSSSGGFFQILLYAIKRLIPLIITYLLFLIGMSIGLVLLIVPGFIFIVGASQAMYFSLIDGQGPIRSIRSSFELTKGNRMKIFILSLALGTIGIALTTASQLIEVIPVYIYDVIYFLYIAYFTILQYAIWRALKKTL